MAFKGPLDKFLIARPVTDEELAAPHPRPQLAPAADPFLIHRQILRQLRTHADVVAGKRRKLGPLQIIHIHVIQLQLCKDFGRPWDDF